MSARTLLMAAATAGPPGASLNLSFMSGTLDPRITFTRASTATYSDSSGVMQTAATNGPRFDYDPVTHAARGLLIEEARTNLWLQSADASNVAWGSTNAGGPALPVVTGNQTVAPDGTMTAARVVYPAVSIASSYSFLYQGPTATAAVHTFSVYLKGSAGGEQLYIAHDGAPEPGLRAILTTQWQRFTFTTPSALSAGAAFFMIGTDLRMPQTSTPAQTIYIWGAQLEAGAFPTSYIPTTAAAVARAADNCQIPPANMGWFVPPGGSWQAEFIANDPAPNNCRVVCLPSSNNRGQIIINVGNQAVQSDATATVLTANSVVTGSVAKAASTWAATPLARICLNAGAIASSAALTAGYPDNAAWGTGFMQYGVAGQGLTGYMRRMRYWPRVLSDAELQAVTR